MPQYTVIITRTLTITQRTQTTVEADTVEGACMIGKASGQYNSNQFAWQTVGAAREATVTCDVDEDHMRAHAMSETIPTS